MSVNGPSALGTLLVQRIDAMLGTSLAQQANVVSGARPDAVSQPTTAERGNPLNNDTLRDPREVVDRSRGQTEQQGRQGVERGTRLDAKTAELLLARQAANTSSTQSAPTRLGFAAQTILALLASFPEQQPVQGRRPLLNQSPGNPGSGEGTARAGQGGQGAASAGGAGQGSNAGAAQGAGGSAQGGAQAAQAGTAGGNAGAASGAQGQGQAAGAAGAGGNYAAAVGTGPAGSGAGSAAAGNAAGAGATTAGSQATQLAALARTPLPSLGGSAAAGGANALAGLQGSSALVGQLAQALSQSVQTSGMFYESHLGNLVFGRGSAQNLQQEPQAQMARGQGSSAAAPSGGAPASAAPGAAAAAAGTAAGAAAGAAQAATAPPPPPAAAQATLTLSGIDPQTQPIVRQQLDVLASQTFAWKGELWPEAPMEWEVGRRDAWTELDGTEHPDHWATRLKVELPTLGEVEARLTLAGNQLVMHLVAPESANLLQHEVETLRGRFSALGLHLSQVSVASQASNEGAGNTAASGMQAEEQPAAWQQTGAPGTEADNPAPAEAEHADDSLAGGSQP